MGRSVVVVVSVVMLGCAREEPAVTTEIQVHPVVHAEPAQEPLQRPEPPFHYDPSSRKDPFRPFFALDDVERPGTGPLGMFELEQLRLTAVIVGTATPTAMIEDPTGMGHLIRVGSLVGKDNAQVKHIRRGEIILEQVILNANLTRSRTLVPMKLGGEPG